MNKFDKKLQGDWNLVGDQSKEPHDPTLHDKRMSGRWRIKWDSDAHKTFSKLEEEQSSYRKFYPEIIQEASINNPSVAIPKTWKGAVAAGLMGLSTITGVPETQASMKNHKHALNITKLSQDEENIITSTLVGEAGGEGYRGMQAVMNVIMNRAHGDIKKAKDVCLGKYQFSMWNNKWSDTKSVIDRMMKHSQWDRAKEIVNLAASKSLTDITGGAKFYFNPSLAKPAWAKSFVKTVSIGNHDFFKPAKIKKITKK